MAALDTDSRVVEQPDELLAASRALLGRVVLVTAYHCAHAQLTHLTLYLSVNHNNGRALYSRRHSFVPKLTLHWPYKRLLKVKTYGPSRTVNDKLTVDLLQQL